MLKHAIKYGDWFIVNDDTYWSVYCYYHDAYDGAPDSLDIRSGYAYTIDQAVQYINDIEDNT